jgi:hypothetical protein
MLTRLRVFISAIAHGIRTYGSGLRWPAQTARQVKIRWLRLQQQPRVRLTSCQNLSHSGLISLTSIIIMSHI